MNKQHHIPTMEGQAIIFDENSGVRVHYKSSRSEIDVRFALTPHESTLLAKALRAAAAQARKKT